jgi:DNA invertase Pin-like site-specific DNA recombinase
MPKPLVAYLRASTREQGRWGLGIDAQRAVVARLAEPEGFQVVAELSRSRRQGAGRARSKQRRG